MGDRRRALVWMAALLAAACAGTVTPTAIPTQALIPPAPTSTPVSQSTEDTALSAPADLVTPTPTAESQVVADPTAAEMIALARRRVAADHDVPEATIRLVEVVAVSWPDTSLGCPQPGTAYTPGPFDGYRVVVAVNDERYVFHTDFDHMIECAAANELLPATPEATAE